MQIGRRASTPKPGYPVYDGAIFSPEALRDPFLIYREIRDLGPVAYLADVGILAISRFKDVQSALRAPQTFISGEGIGFNAIANQQTRERGVLTSDGERHRRLRSVIQRPLMPAALKERRAMLKAMIASQIELLANGEMFDAVPALARHLPIGAVTVLVGLPEESKTKMLEWASAFFNTLGPLNVDDVPPDKAHDLRLLMEVREFFANVPASALDPGSWAAALFDAIAAGKLTDAEARGALRAFVLPSLDTTIYAKGNLLYNLASSPDQWAALKADPGLIPSAVVEGVRHSAVVRAFSRTTTVACEVDGVPVPAGERVMVMFGSANRDERQYAESDRFDVTRNPVDQLGWGTGPHMCVGMHLAKLEMEVMLKALVERVDSIEAGTPTVGTNEGLYGIDVLPLRLRRGS